MIPDCHNPTASVMPLNIREKIAAVSVEYQVFIIEDASYHLLASEPLPALASFAPDQVIHIASLSKSLAPGLRMAYVSVPIPFREAISKALYNLNVTVSPLLSELTARIVVSHQFEALIAGHREQTILRNTMLNHLLKDYTCLGKDTSIFRWLLLPGECTGAQFEALAAQQGVQVYAAERFLVGSSAPEKAVRLSVCAPESLAELERGLHVLKQLLDRITDKKL